MCKKQQIIYVDWSKDFTEGLITRRPEKYVQTKPLKTSDATGFNIEACVCCALNPSVMCDSLQPHRLYPDPDPAGSSVCGVLQPRILKWLYFFFLIVTFFFPVTGKKLGWGDKIYYVLYLKEKEFWFFQRERLCKQVGSIYTYSHIYCILGSTLAHYYHIFKWKAHLFWSGITQFITLFLSFI